jgi:hypothetical protein
MSFHLPGYESTGAISTVVQDEQTRVHSTGNLREFDRRRMVAAAASGPIGILTLKNRILSPAA